MDIKQILAQLQHRGVTRVATLYAAAAWALLQVADVLFPIEQQRELAEGLKSSQRDVLFHSLPSLQGHDAFLVDMDRFRPILCDFFNCTMNQPGQLKSVNPFPF